MPSLQLRHLWIVPFFSFFFASFTIAISYILSTLVTQKKNWQDFPTISAVGSIYPAYGFFSFGLNVTAISIVIITGIKYLSWKVSKKLRTWRRVYLALGLASVVSLQLLASWNDEHLVHLIFAFSFFFLIFAQTGVGVVIDYNFIRMKRAGVELDESFRVASTAASEVQVEGQQGESAQLLEAGSGLKERRESSLVPEYFELVVYLRAFLLVFSLVVGLLGILFFELRKNRLFWNLMSCSEYLFVLMIAVLLLSHVVEFSKVKLTIRIYMMSK